MQEPSEVPARAWVVTFAGTAVNLCLGILYAWSVWKARLLADADHPAGSPMSGLDLGWEYLTDSQATSAYAACGVLFALMMIPGGRIQDRYGPRFGATLGGLFLAGGCVLAGLMKSYVGLILGFGVLGGIGMGLGYAAATPAAVKWFGPDRRGLIVGLVVAGYGGAAIYIAPVAKYLIAGYGISGSFIGLGAFFAVVVIVAARLLAPPPPGYLPPGPRPTPSDPAPVAEPKPAATSRLTRVDWTAREVLRTPQFYALVFLFFGSSQCGLLVIANAAPILNQTAGTLAFFAANAWLLAALRRADQRGRPGGDRPVFRPDRAGERLHDQRPGRRRLPVPDALDHGLGERGLVVPGRGGGDVDLRRRARPDAGLHGGLLRPEASWAQLRIGLPRLGARLLRPPTRRPRQGRHREPRRHLFPLRRPPGGGRRAEPAGPPAALGRGTPPDRRPLRVKAGRA